MSKNEVATVETHTPEVVHQNYETRILDMAIQQGAPLEQLDRYLKLQREQEAYEAKKAYFNAVAGFKQEPISIPKDKFNGHFKSRYTSIGMLLQTINPILGKHGLSLSFDTKQADKLLTVRCVLSHRLGHSESVELSAPPDTTGGNSKNPIQQIKSTFTYLRSATAEAITGLSGTEASSVDDDGNSYPKQKKELTPDKKDWWARAINVYREDKSLKRIEESAIISEENKKLLIEDASI
jgi:hypothetical protein